MDTPTRFSAFQFRDYRLFWLGQLISFSGTWMQSTAQGWLVYSLTKSPFYLGAVSAAGSLPVLLFTLMGGVMADRFTKRNVLLLTQALSMVPALIAGVLTGLGVITIWHVTVLVVFLGTVNAFDIPTRQSFLVEMVQKGNLLNAVALNAAAFNGARIIGPVIAGITIARLGLAACFYLNALSFLAVIIALSMMKTRGEAKAGKGPVFQDLLEGMRFVKENKEILKVMLTVSAFSLFGVPFITMLPVFAEEILKVGPEGLGFLSGSAGLGAFVAAIMLAFKGDVKRKKRLMAITARVFPLALIVFSISTNYYFSMALLVVGGLSIVGFLATANSIVQLSAPDGMRGRVMSVYTVLFLGMMPIGNFLMGTVAASIGTANAVTVSAAVFFLVSMAMTGGMRD